jgi:aminoglycoside 3-N-acetyltransferase
MTELFYRDIVKGLRALGLNHNSHVVAHAALSSFGRVHGGPEAVAAALAAVCGTVLMPAFTYQTLIVPPEGPPNNGLRYADYAEQNANSEFWRPDLPVHRTVGAVAEALRHHPEAWRSDHPVLSFVGVGRYAAEAIDAQLLTEPLAPLDVLLRHDGDLLLLGVGFTRAAIVHLGERRATIGFPQAGQRTFVRWALTTQLAPPLAHPGVMHDELQALTRKMTNEFATPRRTRRHPLLYVRPDSHATSVREIPDFPGCSDGFDQLAPHVTGIGHSLHLGEATLWRYPLAAVVAKVVELIRQDPTALLCSDEGCERCNAVRLTLAEVV